MDTKNKLFMLVGTVAILATAGIGGYTLFTTKDKTGVPTVSTTQSVTTGNNSVASTPTQATSSYKDGTYSASVSYRVPHGTNTLNATVTVTSGTISAVTSTDDYSDGESALYIDSFESGINSAAVGKSLSSISLSRVGGASLTTEAFNNVLDTIRTQASA